MGPKVSAMIALAVDLEKKTVILEPQNKFNVQFEAQREFARQFFRKLRTIIGELSGDLYVLQERQFDPKMLDLATTVRNDVSKILMEILTRNPPHLAGWQFVDYVQDKPHRDVIDNLDFLAQHHLNATKPKGKLPQWEQTVLKHVEVNSFKHLKELAQEIKNYMERNPPLPVPGNSPLPPRPLNPATDPSFLATPEEKTKI